MVSGQWSVLLQRGTQDAAYPDGDEKTKRPQAYLQNVPAGLRHLLPVFRPITDPPDHRLLITDY